jgi:integrase
MASLYKFRGKWWIRYKQGGKWKGKATKYKIDNIGDTKAAEKLCAAQTKKEMVDATDKQSPAWDDWVVQWIERKWGHQKNSTPDRYHRSWRRGLRPWLYDSKYHGGHAIETPARLTYEKCQGYLGWRLEHNGKRNTAISELKFLGQIVDEAIKRSYCDKNPARRLGLRKDPQKHKDPWPDETVKLVYETLDKEMFGTWMHVTFLLGLFQAARLRQCAVPLEAINLNRKTIHYPGSIMKGGEEKAFTQPIDPRLYETLKQIVVLRKSEKKKTLCDIPRFPSIEWKEFLNGLGIHGLSHHGLRATYITKAALAGVPISLTMRFVNHANQEVHRIYQRIGSDDLRVIAERINIPVTPSLPEGEPALPGVPGA